ncbi:MAG: nucleotidyltransferase family protein, partial [Candidatus Helarchaeota archaeon]
MRNNSNSPEIISALKKQAIKFHFKLLAIFGSYARNEQTSESDIDLLVKFHEVPSLIRFI